MVHYGTLWYAMVRYGMVEPTMETITLILWRAEWRVNKWLPNPRAPQYGMVLSNRIIGATFPKKSEGNYFINNI